MFPETPTANGKTAADFRFVNVVFALSDSLGVARDGSVGTGKGEEVESDGIALRASIKVGGLPGVIYLDHNATRPVLQEEFGAMKPYLRKSGGILPAAIVRLEAKKK